MSRVIALELEENELQEFLNEHYGCEVEDNKFYTTEEIVIAIKDEIGCVL